MNIAIVEDETVHSALLGQYIEGWAKAEEKSVHIRCYPDAESFLFDAEDIAFDAVFTDIKMPGMDGMEMVRKLREKDLQISVVFATGIADYMQEGYEVQALHYLLKPISEQKVFACMDRICGQKNKADFLLLSSDAGPVKVDLRKVNYCEASGHYTVFALSDGVRVQSGNSISRTEKELDGRFFVKCHRSYLCNLENIRQITQNEVVFDNGERIPVSRRLYSDVNRAFIRFYSRGQ